MAPPRAVVVVAYGAPDYLVQALAPLRGERVVVVDNSSSSATAAVSTEAGADYLDAGSNLGFAGGVNAGMRHLAAQGHRGDILLLNPDARVESEVIDGLQSALAADPGLAAVSPSLYSEDGASQLASYPLPSPWQVWRFAIGLPSRWERHFVIGAVLLLRAEAVADVGEFDERFFLYGEEVDWQRRAFDRGWRVCEVDAARAIHLGGMSSDDDWVRITRVVAGQETYVHRWHGPVATASFRLGGWIATVLRSRSWSAAPVQARSFRRGPRRVAPLPPAPRPLVVLHLADRGTERAVEQLAIGQSVAGHRVTVVAAVGPSVSDASVEWHVAASVCRAVRAVGGPSPYDVIHAHGSRALTIACATGVLHGARVARSADGPDPSSTWMSRSARALLQKRVDVVVPAGGGATGAAYRVAAETGDRKTNIA